MSDVFDEIAKGLGVTRKTAILTYAPSKIAELEMAISLLIYLVKPSDLDISKMIGELENIKLPPNKDDGLVLSEAAAVVLKNLHSYQLGNFETGILN